LNEEPSLQSGFTGLTSNIKKLADEELRANIAQTSVSITKYTSNIAKFTTQVEKTTKSINVYTTSLEKAKKALAALDDQIINKSKQREQALTNLANKINNIATAVDNLRNAFDALDENAIISRFDGLRELLELAGVIKPTEQGKTAAKNMQQSQPRSQAAAANRPSQNNGNTYNYGFNGARTGHVTFQFANTVLDGTFRST
jgi:chromosome segregation ATPase